MKDLPFDIFFSLLNETRIPYAIAGITSEFPLDIHSDIDIIISDEHMADFFRFMSSLDLQGIKWIQTITHETTAHYFIVSFSDGISHTLLKPDVCSDYIRNGKLFVRAEDLLKNKTLIEKEFYILSAENDFLYYFLKKIDKQAIDERQFEHLLKQWSLNRNGCINAISSYFDENNIVIIEKVFDKKDFSILKSNLNRLRKDLHKSVKKGHLNIFPLFKNKISRILKPTGLVIGIMGPDGSGKTTVIEGFKKNLTDIFRQNEHYHLFPKKKQSDSTNINPHKQKKRGYLGSILKLIYFLGIYIIGYWLKVYPQKIKSTLIIFDRYYHDILVDPQRYRHGAGRGWTKLIARFIPKPDLWILIDVPSTEIQKRKSEVSPEETTRQVIAYRELFENLNNAFIINGNQEKEKVIYDVEEAVINFLKKRIKERY